MMELETYAKCKTCGRDQLAFSLYNGECYYCRGDLVLENEHDPDCKICEEASSAS